MELAVVDLLPVLQDHDDDDDWAGDSDVLVLTKGRSSTTLDLDQLSLWWSGIFLHSYRGGVLKFFDI